MRLSKEKEKAIGVIIPIELYERTEIFLSSPFATEKTKKKLVIRAVTQFLDKEEKVIKEVEKIRKIFDKEI